MCWDTTDPQSEVTLDTTPLDNIRTMPAQDHQAQLPPGSYVLLRDLEAYDPGCGEDWDPEAPEFLDPVDDEEGGHQLVYLMNSEGILSWCWITSSEEGEMPSADNIDEEVILPRGAIVQVLQVEHEEGVVATTHVLMSSGGRVLEVGWARCLDLGTILRVA